MDMQILEVHVLFFLWEELVIVIILRVDLDAQEGIGS